MSKNPLAWQVSIRPKDCVKKVLEDGDDKIIIIDRYLFIEICRQVSYSYRAYQELMELHNRDTGDSRVFEFFMTNGATDVWICSDEPNIYLSITSENLV